MSVLLPKADVAGEMRLCPLSAKTCRNRMEAAPTRRRSRKVHAAGWRRARATARIRQSGRDCRQMPGHKFKKVFTRGKMFARHVVNVDARGTLLDRSASISSQLR